MIMHPARMNHITTGGHKTRIDSITTRGPSYSDSGIGKMPEDAKDKK